MLCGCCMLMLCGVLYADVLWDVVCCCYVGCCRLMLCGMLNVDVMLDVVC